MPKNFEHIPIVEGESAEQDIILDAERSRQIGAKVLASIHYEDKNRNPIVASSYEKARKNKEKFPNGTPAEQRNLAHLRRLDAVIERGGSALEKRIWQQSINNINLVQTEDITESTWRSIQRDNRNHGGGDIELTPDLKEMAAQQYRDVQADELEDIATYLSADNCPYPRWYKIYVWNGLTSLSRKTKNGEDGFPVLQKRDKTTTAGFPKLNPAAIAKVYDDITGYYDMETDAKEASGSTDETDETIDKLVKNGSFAKLYSYELSRMTNIVEVPEKTEDIHGEWAEYDLDHVDEITEAAEGTPWCIVSPAVARNYLKYGEYGHPDEDDWDDDWDDDEPAGDSTKESKGRFVLFHLTDPDTGLPSKQACASIRLDQNGNVAEISGICGGSDQRLNDSLVPIVKEKAMQYPGGEQKMQAFLDNEEIIQLEDKFNKGEAFTDDEVNFIFESKREIEALNPYNRDPRIKELRDVPTLLANGTNADAITDALHPYNISQNLNQLLAAGADVNNIVSKISPNDVAAHLNLLREAGANINFNDLVPKLSPKTTALYLDELRAAGAKIDANNLMPKLEQADVIKNLNPLIAAGAKPGDLVAKLEKRDNSYYPLATEVEKLLDKGADLDLIVSKLQPFQIAENIKFFLDKGAKIDVDKLASELNSAAIFITLGDLLDAGASVDAIIPKLDTHDIMRHLDKLLDKGAKIDDLLSQFKPSDIISNFDELVDAGASINSLAQRLRSSTTIDNLYELHYQKVKIDDIVKCLDPETVRQNRLKLIAAGANPFLVDDRARAQ